MEKKEKQILTQRLFDVVNFNKAYETPKCTYNKAKNLITWGKDNLFPNSLLKLYNYEGASLHKAIINKKVLFSVGQGFNEIQDEDLKDFIKKNDIIDELEKWSKDYEIFNGMAVELIWSLDGSEIVSFKHIPLSQLRFNIVNEDSKIRGFWYCADWKQEKKYTPEFIPEFNEYNREGKQILYYKEYNPDNILNPYPVEGYSNSKNSIETDYKIGVFHLNQANQGYHPSFNVHFNSGIPSTELQDEFYKYFVENFAGTENAGKVFITYSEGTDGEVKINPIALNDSDDRFMMLKDRLVEDITIGAEIPLPLIVPSSGNLSSDDRMELLKEVQMSYISPRQKRIERMINKITSINGFREELTLKKYKE